MSGDTTTYAITGQVAGTFKKSLLTIVQGVYSLTGQSAALTPSVTSGMNVTWSAVSGATSYRLYYGTASGDYIQSYGAGLNVGNVTSYTVEGLSSGTYYVAVTAIDSSGAETGYSNEQVKSV
jgi:hypothetical protein